MPGGGGAQWVDIYQRLSRERIIFLGSEIDDEMANQIIGMLLYLDNENPNQPIYLYINSPGGSVISGLAIFDTIQVFTCVACQSCRVVCAFTSLFLPYYHSILSLK